MSPPASPPPSYTTTKPPPQILIHRAQSLPSTAPNFDEEEDNVGFWGESTHTPEATDSINTPWTCNLSDILSATLYALVVFLLILKVDSWVSSSKGASRWSSGDTVTLHFCQQDPNRLAPGPSIWEYIPLDRVSECRREILELEAPANEEWKLVFDDEILVDGIGAFGVYPKVADEGERESKFLRETVEEEVDGGFAIVPDDVAEEGVMGRNGMYGVSAGVAGRWARRV